MSTVRDICVLVHYSPKWENVFGRMQENFIGNFDPETDKFLALDSCAQLVGLYVLLVFKMPLTATDCY